MTVEAQPTPPARAEDLVVDPFGFWPTFSSRIGRLGGNEPGPDETYAFHTAYADHGLGGLVFTLRLSQLRATRGTLVVVLHALPTHAGAAAYAAAAATQVWLPEIAASGAEITVAVQSLPGTLYALLGHIHDQSDAEAAAIEIRVTREVDMTDYTEKLIAARRTIFGAPSILPTMHLISPGRATMADPVSQMCTSAQFDEPAYAEWMARMHIEDRRHRKHWEFAYILQSLSRYGMLEEGARGLGFGVGTEPLPALMASLGCTVVATDLPPDHQDVAGWSATNQHGADLENLRRPDICDDMTFDRRVSFRPVDMTAIPADLVNFDFTWSSCAYEHLGSIEAGLRFVEDSIACLKPGGVAVHTTELNLSSNGETVDNMGTVLFRRQDFERLALNLISCGHEVAQFKYDQGETPLDAYVDVPPFGTHNHLKLAIEKHITTSFGIIVRRGLRT